MKLIYRSKKDYIYLFEVESSSKLAMKVFYLRKRQNGLRSNTGRVGCIFICISNWSRETNMSPVDFPLSTRATERYLGTIYTCTTTFDLTCAPKQLHVSFARFPRKANIKTELLKHPYTTTATPSYSRYIYQLLIKNRERPFTLQTIAFIFSLPLQLQHLLVAIKDRSNTKQNCGLPASSACYTSLLTDILTPSPSTHCGIPHYLRAIASHSLRTSAPRSSKKRRVYPQQT